MTPAESTTAPTRSTVLLTPVDVPKASDVLARELRERILSGELVEGTALEVQNLIRVRAGRAGGAFVQRPTTKSMANSVSMMIRGQRIRLADLMETREALEPFCAELAARNRTDDDLAMLDKANRDIADPEADLPAFLQANLDWHVGVAMAGRNELLIGFMTALSHAIYTGTENAAFVDDDVRAVTHRAHKSITNAIRSRDAEAAGRRMRRHVHSYAKAALAVDERDAITVDD
jgi:GntR family transcriptional repressor for pyruvate dehydrogenase complex